MCDFLLKIIQLLLLSPLNQHPSNFMSQLQSVILFDKVIFQELCCLENFAAPKTSQKSWENHSANYQGIEK